MLPGRLILPEAVFFDSQTSSLVTGVSAGALCLSVSARPPSCLFTVGCPPPWWAPTPVSALLHAVAVCQGRGVLPF